MLDLTQKAKDASLLAAIDALVVRYVTMLGYNIGPDRVRVRISDRPGMGWKGACTWVRGEAFTTITIHRSVCADFRSLSRIVAHEVCHHVLFLSVGTHNGHGARFLAEAARINAVEGADFVTPECDAEIDTTGQSTAAYHLVLMKHPVAAGRYFFAWAGPKPSATLRAKAELRGAKIIPVRDHRWADRSIPAAQAFRQGRWAVSRAEDLAELDRLFSAA